MMKLVPSESSEDEGDMSGVLHRRSRVLVSSDEESDSAEGNQLSSSSSLLVENCAKGENVRNTTVNTKLPEAHEKKRLLLPFKSNLITESDIESDDSDQKSCRDFVNKVSEEKELDSNYTTISSPPKNDEEPYEVEDIKEKTVHSKKFRKKRSIEKIDPKLLIRSETQRMVRESVATLPYHRPKQRGLRDFISRKKHNIPIDCLRGNFPNLVNTWADLDEDMKLTMEFFKSESDDEEKTADPQITQSFSQVTDTVEYLRLNNILSNRTEKNDSFSEDVAAEKLDCNVNLSREEAKLIIPHTENLINPEVSKIQNFATSASIVISSTDIADCNEVTKTVPKCIEKKDVDVSVDDNVMPNEFENPSTISQPQFLADEIAPEAVKSKPDLEKTPSGTDKAAKWLENIVSYEKVEATKKKLNLLLSPSSLNFVPTLSKTSDEFVDFESPKKSGLLPGAKKLMDRLLKTQPIPLKKPAEVVTTSTLQRENGEITELSVEEITFTSVAVETNDHPGRKFQRFREILRSEIETQWEEELKKRCAEHDATTKEGYENGEVDYDELPEEELEDEITSESEPEEDDVPVSDKPRASCAFGDSEAEESDGEEGDDEGENEDTESLQDGVGDETVQVEKSNVIDEPEGGGGNDKYYHFAEKTLVVNLDPCKQNGEQDDDYDDCTLPPYQPDGPVRSGDATPTQRIQRSQPFSPAISLTDTPKEVTPTVCLGQNVCETPASSRSHLKTPLSPKISVDSCETPSVMKNLFGNNSPLAHQQIDLGGVDDPFMFVSGAFPASIPASLNKPSFSQTRPRRIILQDDSEDSCEPISKETVNIDAITVAKNGMSLLSENLKAVTSPTAVSLPASNLDILSAKKKRKKLTFSDDEDSEPEAVDNEQDDDEEFESEENPTNSDGEVDSENEEGQVEYDSEENEVAPVKPTEFFEKEAELSESEWSGDEDERGLDQMDAEAGDADQFDEEQVASQLGKIHMRRMLDEDARDVRLLQELLFEDGDLHSDGKGRDRKFRWKNLTGFDRDDVGRIGGSDSEGEADQEEEAKLAKLRHEKAQLLLQLEKEGIEASFEEISGKPSLLELGRQLLGKIGVKTIPTTMEAKINPQLCGSFLTKGSTFLSNVARAAGTSKDAPLGPSHSRNFVFAAQSPEKGVNSSVTAVSKSVKRKILSCPETTKRAKLTPNLKRSVSLLDQLD